MGIEHFHTWLSNNYGNSIKEYEQIPYDHIYVDINFLLHRLICYVQNEDELITRVISSLEQIAKMNPPRKTLNLFMDGIAPFAKVILQKQRRMMQSQTYKIEPLCLTPNTLFMNKLNEVLVKYSQGKNIYCNLSDQNGESEFKICKRIHELSNAYESHLVLSNDADVVIIGLSFLNTQNIFILIQQNQRNGNYIIDIDKIADQIFESYGYNLCKKLDFVFLSLLCGNDYFPKLGFTTFEKLWENYSKLSRFETIIDLNHKINVPVFVKFLELIVSKVKNKPKEVTYHPKRINNYLCGLQWCLSLYATGICNNDYLYSGKCVKPWEIIQYFKDENSISQKKLKLTDISPLAYTLLILPKRGLNLVSKINENLLNEVSFLYEEEMCPDCQQMKELVKNKRCKFLLDKDNAKLHDDFSASFKEYMNHKKTHAIKNPIKYITEVVEICKKYQK